MRVNQAVLWLVGIWLVLYLAISLLTMDRGGGIYMACYTLALVLLIVLVDRFRRYLRRQGVSRGRNLALTLVVDVVLAVVLVGGLTGGYLAPLPERGPGGRGDVSVPQPDLDTDPQPLPLTLEDLTGESYPHVSRSRYHSGSFLVREDNCYEYALDDQDDGAILDYTLTTVALPPLRDLAAESILKEWEDRGYYDHVETDPAPGARRPPTSRSGTTATTATPPTTICSAGRTGWWRSA